MHVFVQENGRPITLLPFLLPYEQCLQDVHSALVCVADADFVSFCGFHCGGNTGANAFIAEMMPLVLQFKHTYTRATSGSYAVTTIHMVSQPSLGQQQLQCNQVLASTITAGLSLLAALLVGPAHCFQRSPCLKARYAGQRLPVLRQRFDISNCSTPQEEKRLGFTLSSAWSGRAHHNYSNY